MATRDVAPPANAPAAPVVRTTPIPGDSVAALLREMSQADLTRLLPILDGTPPPGQEARASELLQAAIAAVAGQNPRAPDQLRQLAMLDPIGTERLVSEPALAAFRPAVEQLLSQLAAAAKLHAEGRLGEATRLWETAAGKDMVGHELRPETFLLVAARLIEAGGLANYVRSAAVSGVLVDQCRWAPAVHTEPAPARAISGESRMPIGFLILAWLATGIAGAGVCWWLQYDSLHAVVEVWGAGLVVMVSFGAWQRMRRS
jgi:hypothetical protein